MMLEILYLALVFFGGFHRVEGAEVFAFVGLRIYHPAVDTVLS